MKYIAFDFDGTLCVHSYPEIGEPIKDNIDLLKIHKKMGNVIIIWTGREGKDLENMIEWLKKYNIPYDYINENPEIIGFNARKIFADIYYDDRNGILPTKKIKDGSVYSSEQFKKYKAIK